MPNRNTKTFLIISLIASSLLGSITHAQSQSWLKAAKPIVGSIALGAASCLTLQRLTFDYMKRREPKKDNFNRAFSEDEQTHRTLEKEFDNSAQKVSANLIGGLLSGGAAYALSLALGFERTSFLPALASIGAYATCAITSWYDSRSMLNKAQAFEQWKKKKKESEQSVQVSIKKLKDIQNEEQARKAQQEKLKRESEKAVKESREKLQALEREERTHRAEKQKKEAEQEKQEQERIFAAFIRNNNLFFAISGYESVKNETICGFNALLIDSNTNQQLLNKIKNILDDGGSPHVFMHITFVHHDGRELRVSGKAFEIALENNHIELMRLLLDYSQADDIKPYIDQLKAMGHEIRNHPLVLQVEPKSFYEQFNSCIIPSSSIIDCE